MKDLHVIFDMKETEAELQALGEIYLTYGLRTAASEIYIVRFRK